MDAAIDATDQRERSDGRGPIGRLPAPVNEPGW